MKKLFFAFILDVCVLFFVYVIIETVIVPNFLHSLPLRYHGYLSPQAYPYAESSKRRTIPENYVLVLGDSYAKGEGDWMLNADLWKNGDFNLSHILHRRMNIDVVNLGHAGGSNITGFVYEPARFLEFCRHSFLYRTGPPKTVLILFYEGNDLNDNLKDLASRFGSPSQWRKIRNPKIFRQFIAKQVLTDIQYKWYSELFFLHFFANVVRDYAKAPQILQQQQADGFVNKAIMNNVQVRLPGNLQSPALEFNRVELEAGVTVFANTLDLLNELLPHVRKYVVYIPSVLGCYCLVPGPVSIQHYENRAANYTAEMVKDRSDWLRNRIKEICAVKEIAVIDSKPTIQQAALRRYVHGPRDWKHFNQSGYEALAESVLASIKGKN